MAQNITQLANPVRHDLDRPRRPRARQTLATPAREIGADDLVLADRDVDLDEDPPSAWTPATVVIVEGATQKAPSRSLHLGVTHT